MQARKLLKIPVFFFKLVLVFLGVFWVFILVFAQINYAKLEELFLDVTGFTGEQVTADTTTPGFESSPVTYYIDYIFFDVGFTLSVSFAILGSIILTRKKSVYAAVALFAAYILPREKLYWGKVKDGSNNDFVPFATLRVFKKVEESQIIVSETVADVYGRYRVSYFHEREVEYILEVDASGYLKSGLDLNRIAIPNKNNNIIEDFVLYREKQDKASNSFSYFKPRAYKYLTNIIYFASFYNMVAHIYYLLAYPGSAYAIVILPVYTIAFIWNTFVVRERRHSNWGKIINSQTKQPLAGAMVKVFDQERQIDVRMSDEDGLVKFDLPSQIYYLGVSKPNYVLKQTNDRGLIEMKISPQGHLVENILLTATAEMGTNNGQTFNPFS